jgi:hypothetical protein
LKSEMQKRPATSTTVISFKGFWEGWNFLPASIITPPPNAKTVCFLV